MKDHSEFNGPNRKTFQKLKASFLAFCLVFTSAPKSEILAAAGVARPVGEFDDFSDGDRVSARLHRNHGYESQESQYSNTSHRMFLALWHTARPQGYQSVGHRREHRNDRITVTLVALSDLHSHNWRTSVH